MRLLLLLLLVLAAPTLRAQPDAGYAALVEAAEAAYEADAFARSDSLYAEAFEAGEPSAFNLYNAACSAALAGHADRAFRWLGDALDAGWEHHAHMRSDPDLTALRAEEERWAEIEAQAQTALRERYGDGFNPALYAELIEIQERDQEPRRRLSELYERFDGQPPDSLAQPLAREMMRTDSLHLVRLEEIIAEHGWPTYSLVGREGATAAFLVVQHAELPAQERYLPLMESAVEAGEAAPHSWALLVDRVRVRRGERQLYGSQLRRDPATGAMTVEPIEDEARVDERRAGVGLEPLADYLRRFGVEYAPPEEPDDPQR